jgi:YspA, cpYpsA-related SLOG family
MKLLICGGRDFADYDALKTAITLLNPASIAHGGARGADALADRIAREIGVAATVYPADWQRHGRAAGMIRNGHMLTDYKPDAVLAAPGGPGTANMIERATAAGVRLIHLRDIAPARRCPTIEGIA